MTRTLADMAPAERAACVGMWCEHKHPLYTGMEVIVRVDVTGVNTYSPRNRWGFLVGDTMLGNLTPRLDLPRAWTPDGNPVPVNSEYQAAYYQTINDGTRALALMGVEHPTREEAEWERDDIQCDDSETGFFIARRLITEWEEA